MEKIRKSMRKEDGFTLVELLAVIVILGIIVAIAIPAIGSVIKTSKTKSFDNEKELVLDAARLYFVAETIGEEAEDLGTTVSPKTLITKKYLEIKENPLFDWDIEEEIIKITDGVVDWVEEKEPTLPTG